MRPCVRYLMAAANLLAARPQEVSSLATMDILNAGLNCAASGSAGKRPAVTMRRKAVYFMATSSCSMRLDVNTLEPLPCGDDSPLPIGVAYAWIAKRVVYFRGKTDMALWQRC